MSQSRLGSLAETVIGTLIAMSISLGAQVVIFPFYGLHPSMHQNVGIVLMFTAISLVRSYVVRRLFNWIGNRRPE